MGDFVVASALIIWEVGAVWTGGQGRSRCRGKEGHDELSRGHLDGDIQEAAGCVDLQLRAVIWG